MDTRMRVHQLKGKQMAEPRVVRNLLVKMRINPLTINALCE